MKRTFYTTPSWGVGWLALKQDFKRGLTILVYYPYNHKDHRKGCKGKINVAVVV